MNTKYKYFYFYDATPSARKTKLFLCTSQTSGVKLGEVKWHSPWRQYCFFPEGYALFSKGCLEDVNDFIKQLMDERKERA